jgi:nucleotide-binding universal stress UspA family protein
MATASIQKILVAIDVSERSVQTVHYLADLNGLRDAQIHLLNIFSGIPESFHDIQKEPSSMKMMADIIAWEQTQKDEIQAYFEKCRRILLAADFHPQRIKTIIHPRQAGVAKDIATAAHNGYDALLLRRRGMSKLSGMILGSVATKLLHQIDFLPMIFAGRQPHNNRLLIAMDLSENAMRAVDFAGRMIAGQDCEVGLISVLRKGVSWEKQSSAPTLPMKSYLNAEDRIVEKFEEAKMRLAAGGLDSAKIKTRIIQEVPSRSGAIVDWAQKEDYSTIVMGRKGMSQDEAFTLGQVADKIIHVGRSHHIWLVN